MPSMHSAMLRYCSRMATLDGALAVAGVEERGDVAQLLLARGERVGVEVADDVAELDLGRGAPDVRGVEEALAAAGVLGRSAAGTICWNSLATVMASTITSLALPGCTMTPRTVTTASEALKHS